MTLEACLEIHEDGAARTLMIARPERRNALDGATTEALRAALGKAVADAGVRVIVLTGKGDKAFCAGGDLADMERLEAAGFLAGHESRGEYAALLGELMDCPKPTIARLNGDALGGGLGLAMACDLAVAVETARLGTPEVRVGLWPMMIMAVLLRTMPRRQALELMLTGGRLAAPEALAQGLLNRVVPAAELDAAVAALVEAVSVGSPAVVALGKQALAAMDGMPRRDALRFLQSMLSVNLELDDAREGLGAFLARRAPEWKGR